MPEYREEVLNIALAQTLSRRGITSEPETVYRDATIGRRLPDVLVSFRGLRVVIEGKCADVPGAESVVFEEVKRKVDEGIGHIGVGVVYPSPLRRANDWQHLQSAVENSIIRFRVYSESGERDWTQGTVDLLASVLREIHQEMVQEDVVTRGVQVLTQAIDQLSAAFLSLPAGAALVSRALEMQNLNSGIEESGGKRPADDATRARLTARLAALTVANAMIFQEHLAAANSSVRPLSELLESDGFSHVLAEHWKYIIENIDYVPIFNLARKVLVSLPAHHAIESALRSTGICARQIIACRAALRHDLAGRIYHRLLVEAKFLGTYYTSVPAATILLRLALRPGAWNIDWSDIRSLSDLRIADLASGTGTLLMAAIQAITDNYVRESCRKGCDLNLKDLHKQLVENVIHGYDVLLHAAHLTATTVALLSPDVSFDNMHIWVLNLGGPGDHLGSLDLLAGDIEPGSPVSLSAQFSLQMEEPGNDRTASTEDSSPYVRITGTGREKTTAWFPPLDLCAMNPPFTRSVGGNLLFGSLPAREREKAQNKLRRLLERKNVPASSTAGLGSIFVAAADRVLKPGGRLALVLPRALCSGVAWRKTRYLLSSEYYIEYLVVSHDPEMWNFSENTDLSEILLVARKKTGSEEPQEPSTHETVCLNLWRNPRSTTDALALVDCTLQASPASVHSQGTCRLQTDGIVWGEVVKIPTDELGEDAWPPLFLAQTDLIRVACSFIRTHQISLPGLPPAHLDLVPLESLGSLGPDRRDIHDGFTLSNVSTPYPALWSHDSSAMTTMIQDPNMYLLPRQTPAKGRHLRPLSLLWKHSARVMIAERIGFSTHRLTAALLPEAALSNVWWPFKLHKEVPGENVELVEKAIVLWLNSSVGLLSLLAVREETHGPWCQFKKPVLARLLVPDFRQLDKSTLTFLATHFDRLSRQDLMPFPSLTIDPVRAEIDEVVSRAFGLPQLDGLRELLAREPVVCRRPLQRT